MVRDMVHYISGQKETSITLYVSIFNKPFSLCDYRINTQRNVIDSCRKYLQENP